MQYRPDIVLTDRAGMAVATVEVKALHDASTHNATRYMRNLLVHGITPHARYVMLITPGAGYLWNTPQAALKESPPAFTFPMERIIRHYLPAADGSTTIRGFLLESVAAQWLSDLADGIVVDADVTERLRDAGFVDAVGEGQVSVRASA
jgi:hypothetical protein